MSNRNDADVALELAKTAKYFRSRDGATYADISVGRHRETWGLKSNEFKHWLRNEFFADTERALRPDALKSAIQMLEAKALKDGPIQEVHLRTAEFEGCLYIDLCDEEWQAVRVSADGWSIVQKCSVRFRRTPGMLPILRPPILRPKRGGNIQDLRKYFGKMSEADFVLCVCWALAALRSCPPYPLLALSGPQGAAKSTTARLLQMLVDPSTASLRAFPGTERDLCVSANNSLVLSFDNLSALPGWASDALCRLATGAAHTTRRGYSISDEQLLSVGSPVILNGIVDIVTREDLADRTINIRLEAMDETTRNPERELRRAFETARPRLFGALLDGLVEGLKNQNVVACAGYARMLDFAQWCAACETAYWPAGTAEAAYRENIQRNAEDFADTHTLSDAVRALISDVRTYRGTAQDLLSLLTTRLGEHIKGDRQWPRTARAFSGQLRRIEPVLRKLGICVEFDLKEGHNRNRVILIQAAAKAQIQGDEKAKVTKAPKRAPMEALPHKVVQELQFDFPAS